MSNSTQEKVVVQMDQNFIEHSQEAVPLSRDASNYEIIRPRNLPFVTGLSRTTCWRLSKDPTSGFPRKIRLSAGAVGYRISDIQEWLNSRQIVAEG